MRRIVRLLAIALALSAVPVAARLPTPSAPVFDQTGRKLDYAALVKGKTAVISFIFTGCSSTCPIIGRKVAQVLSTMSGRAGKDIVFIGISVDPIGDSSAAMSRYSRTMGFGPGWHFLNSSPQVMQQLRERLGGGEGGGAHSNYLIIANDRTGQVSRIDAVTNSSATIASRVKMIADGQSARSVGTATYFAAGKLRTAKGTPVDFYQDVVAGQVVLVSTLFTRCVDACPLITQKLVQTRKLLGPSADRVRFVSLTSDPAFDTPARLAGFAAKQGVGGNWVMLTGSPADVETILAKFNLKGSGGSDHSTALIVGNDQSGSWRRISPAISPADLAKLLRQVMTEKAS